MTVCDVAGRSVLVTGSGSGIGRAIALLLGRAGAHVVVTDVVPGSQEAVAREIVDAGGTAIATRCDVTVRAEVEAAVALARECFGGLDALVHNATSARSSETMPLEHVTEDHWASLAGVSMRGAFLCAQAAFPELKERSGTLVLFLSSSPLEGRAERPVYAAVKGAERGLAKSLAKEWGSHGVRVNCVVPTGATASVERAFEADDALKAARLRRVPLGRFGDPLTDIAPVVLFLVSDASRFLTGQTIVASGGSYVGF